VGVTLRVNSLDYCITAASILNLAIFAHLLKQSNGVNVCVSRQNVSQLARHSPLVNWQDLNATGEIVSSLELFDQRVQSEAISLHLLSADIVAPNVKKNS